MVVVGEMSTILPILTTLVPGALAMVGEMLAILPTLATKFPGAFAMVGEMLAILPTLATKFLGALAMVGDTWRSSARDLAGTASGQKTTAQLHFYFYMSEEYVSPVL